MEKNHLPEGIQLRILPYAHCDLAALHTRAWHKARYQQIFDAVAELAEKMPEFRWYFDCYRSQLEFLFDKYPEKKDLFERLLLSRQVEFIGAYANIRPNMVGEETYLRNFFMIREILPHALSDIYGEEVDVALGHAQIPQILRQFGYSFYKVFRPNDVLDAKGIPSSFLWKGADGSDIFVIRSDYSAFDKNGTENIHTAADAENYLYENARECIEKSDIDLVWVNCGCDDTLPFLTNQANNEGAVYKVDIPKVLALFNGDTGNSVRLSSPSEFCRELENYKKDLRTFEKDLDCADVSYNIAINGEKGFVPLRLLADQLLTQAERWQVFAETIGIRSNFEFKMHWKRLLTACCHATQWLFEEDYRKVRGLLESVVRDTRFYLQTVYDEIAKRIDAKTNTIAVFFNDSPYSQYRTVKLTFPCANVHELELEDGRGDPVAYEIIGTHDYNNTWEVILLARLFLPSYGYNTIRAKSGDIRSLTGVKAVPKPLPTEIPLSDTYTVCGGGFRLTFEGGNLVKINGFSAKADNSFNKLTYYGYPFYGSWAEGYSNESASAVWKSVRIIHADEKYLHLVLQGILKDIPVEQTIQTCEGRLDFTVSFDWKPANAWLTASIPCDSCSDVFCDMPFGTRSVNVEKEYSDEIYPKCILHRKRKGVITAKRFISARCNGMNVALLRGNGDRYFHCDTNKKNLGIILLNSIIRTKNTWEEDVNADVEAVGNHSVRYSVLFDTPSEENIAPAFAVPFFSDRARQNPPLAKKLPPFASLFSLQGENVLLTSLRRIGNAVYLRLVETRGTQQDISFPKSVFKSCESILLSGQKQRDVLPQNNEFRYTMKPFEIVTFRLVVSSLA